MFKREPLQDEVVFIANGDTHVFKYKMRPISRGEFLTIAIQYPVVSGFLLGTQAFPYTVRKEGDSIVYDYSQFEAFLNYIDKNILFDKTIDDQPFEGSILDLPDLVAVNVFAKFRNFQFLAQGDVDFFNKIDELMREYLPKPSGLE